MGPQPATGLQRGGFFWQPIDACMSIRRQPGGFFFTNFVLPHDFRYKHAPPASHGRQPAAPVTGAMPKVFDWFQCNACNLFLPLVQPYPVTPRRCNRCIAEGTLDPAFFFCFFLPGFHLSWRPFLLLRGSLLPPLCLARLERRQQWHRPCALRGLCSAFPIGAMCRVLTRMLRALPPPFPLSRGHAHPGALRM